MLCSKGCKDCYDRDSLGKTRLKGSGGVTVVSNIINPNLAVDTLKKCCIYY